MLRACNRGVGAELRADMPVNRQRVALLRLAPAVSTTSTVKLAVPLPSVVPLSTTVPAAASVVRSPASARWSRR